MSHTLTRPCPTCETEAPLIIAKHQTETWKTVHAVTIDCCERQPADVTFTCDDHTVCPEGYVSWHNWATEMQKTHRQVRCDECGRWHVWLPKHLDG